MALVEIAVQASVETRAKAVAKDAAIHAQETVEVDVAQIAKKPAVEVAKALVRAVVQDYVMVVVV